MSSCNNSSLDSMNRSPAIMVRLVFTALVVAVSSWCSGAKAGEGAHHLRLGGGKDISIVELEANARRLEEIASRRQADLEEQGKNNYEDQNRDRDARRSQAQNNQNAVRPIGQKFSSRHGSQENVLSFVSPYIVEPNSECLVHENRSDRPGWSNRCDSSLEVYWCASSECDFPNVRVTVVANGWTDAVSNASKILVCPSRYILRSDYKCHGHSE